MKGEIGRHRVVSSVDGDVDRLQVVGHRFEVLACTMSSRKASRFNLDGQPQLQHVTDIGQAPHLIRSDPESRSALWARRRTRRIPGG